MIHKRYVVVGGNPFSSYTGTCTYTSLRKIAIVDSVQEANQVAIDHYDECGGLIGCFEVSFDDIVSQPISIQNGEVLLFSPETDPPVDLADSFIPAKMRSVHHITKQDISQ
jgi:hypothetical protein